MFPRYQSRQIKPRFEWRPRMDPNHPLSVGCVGFWLFNETGGLTAYDLSNLNNHGTLTNGPTRVPGRLGQAISFDGSDDYVATSVGNSVKGLSQATISVRIKFSLSTGYSSVYAEPRNIDGSNRFLLMLDDARFSLLVRSPDSADGTVLITSNLCTAGVWYHVVGVYDSISDVHHICIDGVDKSNSVAVGSIDNTDPDSVPKIGSNPNGLENFTGLIEEVRIYKRALSPQEIQWLYEFPYDNLIVEPTRKFWFIPEVAAGGLSIPVAMRTYRNRRVN